MALIRCIFLTINNSEHMSCWRIIFVSRQSHINIRWINFYLPPVFIKKFYFSQTNHVPCTPIRKSTYCYAMSIGMEFATVGSSDLHGLGVATGSVPAFPASSSSSVSMSSVSALNLPFLLL